MAEVKIHQQGPSGTVQYIEDEAQKHTCNFFFEFGGGKTIAIVTIPAEERWDKFYPWAAGRRMEILTFVAEELRREQAPSSTVVWQGESFSLVKK
ncbi:MAG: hypothetical protein IPN96_19200 [Anaerolineales bacterium]|nr:hypothetical protein [Anaerolineales bacterium]